MTTLLLCWLAYLAFNFIVYLVYWWDKEAARNGDRRVPESTLLWLAFLGGSAGAVSAQQQLRHKTRKEPFRSILIGIVILHVGLVVSLIIMPDWPFRIVDIVQTQGWMR